MLLSRAVDMVLIVVQFPLEPWDENPMEYHSIREGEHIGRYEEAVYLLL